VRVAKEGRCVAVVVEFGGGGGMGRRWGGDGEGKSQ